MWGSFGPLYNLNEHSFIRSIHNYLDPNVYKWKIHDTFTGGVPDAFYSGPAGSLFVEYKYIKQLPKKNITMLKHSLSKLQEAWLERVYPATPVALILGVEDTALIILDDFSFGISKMHYIDACISRRDVAEWIFNLTHDGATYERFKADTSSRSESAQDLATEKSRNAFHPSGSSKRPRVVTKRNQPLPK